MERSITIADHTRDFDAVVVHLRHQGAHWVCAVGHSFGAPVILLSQAKTLDALVLWDPSYAMPVSFKNAGHTFDEDGAEEHLFRETLDWITKYCPSQRAKKAGGV